MKVTEKQIKEFQEKIWTHYKANGRGFPWRETSNPYFILVSEMMLQQTQADRVVRYYEAFIKKFPTPEKLARAKFQTIYKLWQGLGYNRRAMFLKRAAEKAVKEYKGKFPSSPEELLEFPGIGPYTARAVSIFSFNTPVACVETNIRRVYIHEFFQRKKIISEAEIEKLAELCLPKENSREWHWALMDYGAMLGATLSKSKGGNPNRRHKDYSIQSKFEGSGRQTRGLVLRLLSGKKMSQGEIEAMAQKSKSVNLSAILDTLQREGLVGYNKQTQLFYLR